MAQHFLLSAAARTLSLKAIYQAGEEAAYAKFCEMRWTDGEPVCPDCGCCETYTITTRRKFKCKGCYRRFSVTSGTVFALRKMAFVDLLAAICITANASKGVSMIQLSRDLDCQYKTAFVLAHKLREAMALEVQTGETLDGHVEIDGAYFGGTIRAQNHKADRVDRRRKESQNGQRRVVVVMRERFGRTLPTVTIGPKAISAACVAWSLASTTLLARNTCNSMPTALGRATGSGRHEAKTQHSVASVKSVRLLNRLAVKTKAEMVGHLRLWRLRSLLDRAHSWYGWGSWSESSRRHHITVLPGPRFGGASSFLTT